MALIEIDGLPFLKMVIFHGYVSHNQRVSSDWLIQKIVENHGEFWMILPAFFGPFQFSIIRKS